MRIERAPIQDLTLPTRPRGYQVHENSHPWALQGIIAKERLAKRLQRVTRTDIYRSPKKLTESRKPKWVKKVEEMSYGKRRPITLFQRSSAPEAHGDFLHEHVKERKPTLLQTIRIKAAEKISEQGADIKTAVTNRAADGSLDITVRARIARAAVGEKLAADTVLQKKIGRRPILKAAAIALGRFAFRGGLTASGSLNVDTYIGNEVWGGTNPKIETIPNKEAAEKNPYTHTLVIGGYNVDDPDVIGDAISDTMFKYSQVSYLKHSNEGLQIDDLKRTAEAFVKEKDVKQLYLYGHSMGGMVAIELAAHLAELGVYINTIILDCSPLNYADLRDNRRDAADKLVFFDKMSVTGGPVTRFGIEFLSRWYEGRRDLGQMCVDAISEVKAQGCSNKLIQTQARYMEQFTLENFKDSFKSSTRFVRLRPDNIFNDTTIDNERSQGRLLGTFPDHVVEDQPVVGGGHASPIQIRTGYNDALQAVAKKLYFFDAGLRHNRRILE